VQNKRKPSEILCIVSYKFRFWKYSCTCLFYKHLLLSADNEFFFPSAPTAWYITAHERSKKYPHNVPSGYQSKLRYIHIEVERCSYVTVDSTSKFWCWERFQQFVCTWFLWLCTRNTQFHASKALNPFLFTFLPYTALYETWKKCLVSNTNSFRKQ
jgi:hypothetical protein